MKDLLSLNPYSPLLRLFWSVAALSCVLLLVAPSSLAFDHPRDDGHGRRTDPEEEPDLEKPPEEPQDECTGTGSPVYLQGGSLVLSHEDLLIHDRLPLNVVRSYNSQDDRNGLVGKGWTHGYELRTIPVTDGSVEGAIVRWTNGQRQSFVRQPDGTYTKPLGCPLQLAKTEQGFLLQREDDIFYKTDQDGDLIEITDRNGYAANITNDPLKGCVNHIDYPGGRIAVSYGANGKIASITAPGGRGVSYSYDERGNLVEFTDSMGSMTSYTYDGEDRMTGIFDPMGRQTLSAQYDSANRVSRIVYEDGDFSYSYGADQTVRTDNDTGGQWIYEFDLNGVVTRISDPMGGTTTTTYDAQYNVSSVTDAEGHVTRFTYDLDGNLLTETDPLGNITSFSYNSLGLPVTVTDPLGVSTRFDYDENGNVLQRTEALGGASERVSQFTYDDDGNMLSRTDPAGNTMTMVYDSQGRLIRENDPQGHATILQYDSAGNVTSKTDKNGDVTSYVFDEMGNVTSVTYPDGTSETIEYNAAGQLARETDQLANAVLFEYDAFGRLTRREDPLGNEQQFTYDLAGRPLTRAEASVVVESWSYDVFGRISSRTGPTGATTRFTYTPSGQIATETSPLGAVTSFSYDAAGRVVRTVDPVGGETLTEYDGAGRRTAMTDANGNRTEFVYDSLGRQTVQRNPDGSTQLFQYDLSGNLVSKVDEVGGTTRFEYNQRNERTRLIDPGGLVITYGYDADGNPTTRTLPDGTVQTVTYDSLDRRTRVEDNLGVKQTNQYDAAGRATSAVNGIQPIASYERDAVDKPLIVTDAAGRQTRFEYDHRDRLAKMTDPEGRVTEYRYDPEGRRNFEAIFPSGTDSVPATTRYDHDPDGNMIRLTDANGGVTTYEYDLASRLIQTIYPDGTGNIFSYDGVGNLISQTDGDGQVTAFSYDFRGNLLRADFPDGSWKAFTYALDGRMLVAENPHSRIAFSYDASRRIASISQTGSVPVSYSFTVSYAYSVADNKVTISYPSGKTVEAFYSPRDEFLRAVENGVETAALQYDAGVLRKLTGIDYANGTSSQYEWDSTGAPVSARHLGVLLGAPGTIFSGYSYILDASGAVVGRVNDFPFDASRPDTFSISTTLDGGGRLISATEGGPGAGQTVRTTSWTLDGPGNWTKVTRDGDPFSNTTTAANQYAFFESTPNTHDSDGNLISDSERGYAYDFENRLTGATGLGGDSNYWYDALGRRVAKQAGGTSTVYVHGLSSQVLEEYEDGVFARNFVWAGPRGRLLTMQDSAGQRYYYHRDAAGSAVALTDAGGRVAELYAYDVYGAPTILDGGGNPLAASQVGNSFLFANYRWDPEIDAYSTGQRIYQPKRGRFLQRDALETASNTHTYAYVGNDPLNYYDALGFERASDWSAGVSAEVAAYTGLGADVSVRVNPDFKDCCDENRKKVSRGEKKVTVKAKVEAGIGIGAKFKAFGFSFSRVLKGPQVSTSMNFSFSNSKCGGPFDTFSRCSSLSFDPTASGSLGTTLGTGPFKFKIGISFTIGTHWFLRGCTKLSSANGRSLSYQLEGCASAEATVSITAAKIKYTDGWKGEEICKDFLNRSYSF